MIRIDIATLFTGMCETVMDESIIGRARREHKFELYTHQIRDFTINRQKQVDDYPYGGGHGMVMQADPIARCLDFILWQYEKKGQARPRVCFMTPAGRPYDQAKAKELARLPGLVLVCGHYEGIDERVIEAYADEEISIGDYVLTGGELAALSVADSVLRLQPGVLSSPEGYQGESFYDGLLEYPQYSRPEVWRDRAVPPVLLSGHAANIRAWRAGQGVSRTRARRPDLYLALPPEVASPPAKLPKKKRKR
ncbi:tRNA (guanosine(37)-N1)-methyltransferase TrmD [Ruminococcaceae bacterium OttesenSCG-928-D13]|nr:tRNA (guanosine(37)-N1)-methyltransferase TrmD [Ruminococcaceae bacterium OttesenSCG-928-D13]